MKKIAFQGELGAYSHLACIEAAPDHNPVACRTFESAMEQVNASECHLAMIPIENSVAGRVADIHYLLGGYDLKIYSEHFQEINHQLMVKPGASLDTIKNVRSHSMAIGQCHAAIKKYNLDVIIMADTAGSAKFISEQGTMEDSAIASTLAADTYGLDIVDTNIQDMKSNTTRFLIMSKELQQERNENLSYLTSCIFEVKLSLIHI